MLVVFKILFGLFWLPFFIIVAILICSLVIARVRRSIWGRSRRIWAVAGFLIGFCALTILYNAVRIHLPFEVDRVKASVQATFPNFCAAPNDQMIIQPEGSEWHLSCEDPIGSPAPINMVDWFATVDPLLCSVAPSSGGPVFSADWGGYWFKSWGNLPMQPPSFGFFLGNLAICP